MSRALRLEMHGTAVLLAIALLPSQAAAAQTDSARAHRIDRFLAAIPAATPETGSAADAERGVLSFRTRFVARMLRATAESLDDRDLEAMTAFYAGPDFARFAALGAEAEQEGTPQSAERRWLLAAYPLERFSAAMHAQARKIDFAAFGKGGEG